MNEMTTIEPTAATPAPVNPATVFEAIVKRQCLSATYNRGEVVLAPHAIFTRHDEMFVDAIVIERDGKPPKEVKLGNFKLVGLGALRLTPRRFTPSNLFDAADVKYTEGLLLAVERG